MKTKIWDMRAFHNDVTQHPDIKEIKSVVEQGGLIGLPTETVYGLAANAKDEQAVSKIYEAKGRPSDNPLIVHIHDMKQLHDFTYNIDPRVIELMTAFWPGPISFILPLKEGYLCSKVTGGLESVAVRMPSHSVGRQILQAINEPLAAPSANLSGRPSPTTFEHVYHDLNGRIDGIIQANQSEEGLESTVLDCTSFPFKIARPGSITTTMIEQVIPNSVVESNYNNTSQPIAPGMKYKHYSPETSLKMITNLTSIAQSPMTDFSAVAFIVPKDKQQFLPKEAKFIELCKNDQDIRLANHRLYSILHDIDKNDDIKEAYIYSFELNDQTEAIVNRISKAAGNQSVEGRAI
ncbi:threonylcarbamoyl-AMP synthase [Staphylococcus simiae]|uniref:L-threonylcarbamoyladenylate synthase n=1 Tax=Staphylococcus simiae TaxID=308354 RepID=UPI001A95CA66|nr:L-threonylcarbamoyladenylate synthase [Staphylococcus simiae]MBO1199174.1 threonylcarbamoyl-AMP synthase [Staphylococcus simiae]MBO1201375.1 threonylcarbamoyl-AMP synthase [Staphylococcus simiae]MBO1203523.1 threonylcarbamoyl-AMP synthase [Staphylococcus simiae]MBO1211051.1 threonylcarbamoyl-AMP synthase [Staphylococcus simiae]MBO1229669.1 threonylcarbamoyl-AMP synthase [Staphylococcus simiae]